MFTEEDSKRQDAAFEALKAEFQQLTAQEEALRKAAGDIDVDFNNVSPEMRKLCEEAQKQAQQAGAARAAEFAQANQTSATQKAVPGGRRQGVMRI